MQSICNKSRKLVGLLYCQFYLNADSDTLRQFYLSSIRPHLEYACTVWDPYLAKREPLPAKYAVRTGIWPIRTCWAIWIFQRCNKWGYSMMYRFVHSDSYIPDKMFYSFILPPTMTHVTILISLFPVLEQMVSYCYSFFPHITFLELTSTYWSSGTE